MVKLTPTLSVSLLPPHERVVEHPCQMRQVDARHGGTRADKRIERHDGLVGVLVREAVDEMDLGADAERGAGGGVLDRADDEVGRPDVIGDLAHVT